MCVTSGPAQLSDTILYAGQTQHEGRLVHILGYQNRARTRSGPNAMLLPFPSRTAMGPENMIDTSHCKILLKQLAALGDTRMRSATKGLSLNAAEVRRVQVFNAGSYTVVMSQTARLIPEALAQMPEDRRPRVNTELFEAYTTWYPSWPVALCCWDGAVDAEPLLWWYEPQDETTLFYPGLDSHDGGVPRLGVRVDTDHKLIWPNPKGVATASVSMTPEVRALIAPAIDMRTCASMLLNGDWWLPVNGAARDLALALHTRRAPPGAPPNVQA